jgi:hypothetical protein
MIELQPDLDGVAGKFPSCGWEAFRNRLGIFLSALVHPTGGPHQQPWDGGQGCEGGRPVLKGESRTFFPVECLPTVLRVLPVGLVTQSVINQFINAVGNNTDSRLLSIGWVLGSRL